MDIRGGGQAAEDRRIVKEEDYASDNDADFMEDDKPHHHHQQQARYAQQAPGFQNDLRAGTPGRGSAVRASSSLLFIFFYLCSLLLLWLVCFMRSSFVGSELTQVQPNLPLGFAEAVDSETGKVMSCKQDAFDWGSLPSCE